MSADSTISALSVASALTGAEIIPIDQGSTKQAQLSKLFSDPLYKPSGTVGRSLNNIIGDVVNVKNPPFNAVGDGVTDDTAAIIAGIAGTPIGLTLHISGTPLISSKITINRAISIVFDGAGAGLSGDNPSSYFLKKSTMTTAAVDITARGVIWRGGGVVGQGGNTGDGIDILAEGVVLDSVSAFNCGNDGIRVGSDTGVNANVFRLLNCSAQNNGRHGFYIHDSSVNANAGTLISPFAGTNTGDGIKFGTAAANSCVGPLCESNTGIGLHFATGSLTNSVFGGDVNEANTAGNLTIDSGASNNQIFGLDYGTTVTDNGAGTVILSSSSLKTQNSLPNGLNINGGATATIFTIAAGQCWLVYITQGVEFYAASGIVQAGEGATVADLGKIVSTNANLQLAVSGLNVQAFNGTGGVRTVKYSALRMY